MTRFGGFFLLWACQFENEKTAVRRLGGGCSCITCGLEIKLRT